MAGPRTLLKAIGQFSVFFKRFDAASWRFATPGVDNCVVLHTVQPPLSARQPELDWPPGPPQSYGRDVPSSPPPSRAVRVLIADDHRLFAESLLAVLADDDRVDVVGIAPNGVEAVQRAVELQPDVILMDIKMPLMDGLEATRRIREAGLATQVVLLTGGETGTEPDDASKAGAVAFIRKERGVEEIRDVFLEVASLAAVLAPGQ
jgi:CheY-like chemotaxis protein